MSAAMSPAQFMAATPHNPDGNTAWAQRTAAELRAVIVRQAGIAPRSTQAHLGPSELGASCDRQVVGKMTAEPRTNHVSDPWPSVVGTAVHAWLAQAFRDENARNGTARWVTECRVAPHPLYPGTADLYDAAGQAVIDHKVLGPTSLAKVRSESGPSRRYIVQLLLYARGYRNLGLPVRRVALAAYPRTAATLDGTYVWERECSAADDELIDEVLRVTSVRKMLAAEVLKGGMTLRQIPITPDSDECFLLPTLQTSKFTR